MKKFLDLFLKGLWWSIPFSILFFFTRYLIFKKSDTLIDIIIGILLFTIFGGPLFVVLKSILQKHKKK